MSRENYNSDLFECQHFQTIILCRAIASGAGVATVITVLLIILFTRRSKSWDNLPKRVLIAAILSNGAYFLSAIAGVDYTHSYLSDPDNKMCQVLGYLLHYTGTLSVVFYICWIWTLVVHTMLPVMSHVLPKCEMRLKNMTIRKQQLAEALMYILLILCPCVLNTWEPFVPQFNLSPNGAYGPWCWFKQSLPTNCSNHSEWYNHNALFLVAMPYAIITLLSSLTLVLVVAYWCRFYHTTAIEISSSIAKIIRTILLYLVVSMIATLVFSITVVLNVKAKWQAEKQSMASWINDAILNILVTMIFICAVSFFQHFSLLSCTNNFIKYIKDKIKFHQEHNTDLALHETSNKSTSTAQSQVLDNTTFYTARESTLSDEKHPLLKPCK